MAAGFLRFQCQGSPFPVALLSEGPMTLIQNNYMPDMSSVMLTEVQPPASNAGAFAAAPLSYASMFPRHQSLIDSL